jgi:hypothetical protein
MDVIFSLDSTICVPPDVVSIAAVLEGTAPMALRGVAGAGEE